MSDFVEKVRDIVVPPYLSRLQHAGRSLAAVGLATICAGFSLGVKNFVQGFEDDNAANTAQTFGAEANLYAKEAAKDFDAIDDMEIAGVGFILAGVGTGIGYRESKKRVSRLERSLGVRAYGKNRLRS